MVGQHMRDELKCALARDGRLCVTLDAQVICRQLGYPQTGA